MKSVITVLALSILGSLAQAQLSPGVYHGRTNTWLGGMTAKPCVLSITDDSQKRGDYISEGIKYKIEVKPSYNSDSSYKSDQFTTREVSLKQEVQGRHLKLSSSSGGMDQAKMITVNIQFSGFSNIPQFVDWSSWETVGIFFPTGRTNIKCEHFEKVK